MSSPGLGLPPFSLRGSTACSPQGAGPAGCGGPPGCLKTRLKLPITSPSRSGPLLNWHLPQGLRRKSQVSGARVFPGLPHAKVSPIPGPRVMELQGTFQSPRLTSPIATPLCQRWAGGWAAACPVPCPEEL